MRRALVAWTISRTDGTYARKTVTREAADDRPMITEVVYDECINVPRRSVMTKSMIVKRLKELNLLVLWVKPSPDADEKLKALGIIDDIPKILYGVNTTDITIFVTLDDDFTGDVANIRALITDPESYLKDEGRREYF